MTIKVYRSIMPQEPDEVYQDHGISVEDWVKGQTSDYKASDHQPISCSINGQIVKPAEWPETIIESSDVVEFRVMPQGDSLNFLNVIFPGVFTSFQLAAQGIQSLLTPDLPSNQRGQGRQGTNIEPAEARANTARLGQAVPEGMGFYVRYPDYLNQPRRYYLDKKTQVLNLFLSVGVGSYQINTGDVRIGQTKIADLSNVDFEIFDPGQDVSGNEAHENWYPSPEVGATTSSTGIRLEGVTFDERSFSGSVTGVDNRLLGVTIGELWTLGISGSIDMTQNITVSDGGAGVADTITGNFQHLVAGLTVNVTSDVNANGTYVITTINVDKTEITLETTGGAPVEDLTAGSGTMSIDKAGTKYELDDIITGIGIQVRRILDSGASDPDWTFDVPQTSLDVDIEWDGNTFTANRAGPFVACPEGETTDTVEVDIFAPQGLGTVSGESISSRSRTVKLEWREVGTSTWNEQDEVVSGSTRDQLGFTFTLNLGSQIRPEIRVSRIGNESVAVTALDRLEFTALRSKLPTPTSYANITTMAINITGSDEIGSGSNNRINLDATRELPEISGGAFTAATPTRKISAGAAYVAKSLGYDDSQIDLAELERLEGIWTPRGDTFDYFFTDTTAQEAIKTILRSGFAEPTIDNGVIKPVRDEPRTVFEQGYSPENMTAPLVRTFQAKSPEESDGVEVEYTKEGTWTKEVVNAFLPGDLGVKVDKITVDGVTNETRAWRIGMRRRRSQKYRRWSYTFNTELDALNSEYLSYVPLLDDIPDYGKASILLSISSDRIVVSEPLNFIDGENHVVAYRDSDGTVVGPFTATPGPDEYTALVTIPEPFPAVNPANQEPTHIYFGTTDRWHFPALITEINPSGPLETSVVATNYDARVYDDDDNAPP